MTAALVVIGLMVLGLALLAIEVFVIPGFGVVGVLGAAAMIGSVWFAYHELSPASAAVAVVAGACAGGVLLWLFPRTSAGRAMVLESATTGRAARPTLARLTGREGVAVSDLRPSGTAEIDGAPVDVITDGQYVERGTKIRVARVEGARVVVEPLAQTEECSGNDD
ncbi:MAG: hypothetical protein D6689_07370 [Deltaproteobacteria bacterium]|nr:MAG: hypothetical protein D6689_07370 [Deltaproteobacteria bacterium]